MDEKRITKILWKFLRAGYDLTIEFGDYDTLTNYSDSLHSLHIKKHISQNIIKNKKVRQINNSKGKIIYYLP